MSEIPEIVADDEILHRRVHRDFVKPDGSISSQAFTDPEMSADRSAYWSVALTLRGFQGFGVASVSTAFARSSECAQEVVAVPELLNPAHAHVNGRKNKRIARALARAAGWVVQIDCEGNTLSIPDSVSTDG